jgi:protein-tyrosine phosphatase
MTLPQAAMIDLHSHILPSVDDGAPDLTTALKMAHMAVDDGIAIMACTPHMLPGVYDNDAADIRDRVSLFDQQLRENGVGLCVVVGSDAHIRPDFISRLQTGHILTLNDSRYVLVEPPHSVMPRNLDNFFFNILMAGYVPILTHPERLVWLSGNYSLIENIVRAGAWLQLTAGSLCGNFGRTAQYWAQRLLADGLVHIVASDAHNLDSRAPRLSKARELVVAEVGINEATHLFVTRPQQILDDVPVAATATIEAISSSASISVPLWRRLFRGELA